MPKWNESTLNEQRDEKSEYFVQYGRANGERKKVIQTNRFNVKSQAKTKRFNFIGCWCVLALFSFINYYFESLIILRSSARRTLGRLETSNIRLKRKVAADQITGELKESTNSKANES